MADPPKLQTMWLVTWPVPLDVEIVLQERSSAKRETSNRRVSVFPGA